MFNGFVQVCWTQFHPETMGRWMSSCTNVVLFAGAGNEADGPGYETDQGPTTLTNVDLRAAVA